MKRKVLAIVTAACLVLSMIPSMAFASTDQLWGDKEGGATYLDTPAMQSDADSDNAYAKVENVYFYDLDNAVKYASQNNKTVEILDSKWGYETGDSISISWKYKKDSEAYEPAGNVVVLNKTSHPINLSHTEDTLVIPEGTSLTFEGGDINLKCNIDVQGTLVLKDVNIVPVKDFSISVGTKGTLTIDSDSKIKESTSDAQVSIIANGGKIDLAGELYAEDKAIVINGGEVNINKGAKVTGENAIVAPAGNDAKAFTLNVAGTVKGGNIALFLANKLGVTNILANAEIAGKTAIWAKNGALNINSTDGNIVIIGKCKDEEDNDPYVASGDAAAKATGDAIVIEKNKTNPQVKIFGETNNLVVAAASNKIVQGNRADADVVNLNKAVAVYPSQKIAGFIAAGLYSTDVTQYLVKGYSLNKYNVSDVNFGKGTKYESKLTEYGVDHIYKVVSAKVDISKCRIVLDKYVVPFNSEGNTDKPVVKVYYGKTELEQYKGKGQGGDPERDCDYTVKYEGDQSVGKAKIIIEATDLGNYTGKKVVYYYVKGDVTYENLTKSDKKDGSYEYTVAVIGKKFVYCGQEIKPMVMVKIGSLLANPKDYDVTYEDNKDAGIAKVVVTSKIKNEDKPKYKGKASFEIQKKDLVIIPESYTKEAAAENATLELKSTAYGYILSDKAAVEAFINEYIEYVVTDSDDKEIAGIVGNDNTLNYANLAAGIYKIKLDYDNVSLDKEMNASDIAKVLSNYNVNVDVCGALVIVDSKLIAKKFEGNNFYQNLFAKYGTKADFAKKIAAAVSGAEKYYEGIFKTAQKIQSYWAKLSQCKCDKKESGNENQSKAADEPVKMILKAAVTPERLQS